MATFGYPGTAPTQALLIARGNSWVTIDFIHARLKRFPAFAAT
jgi:hypothetical protein